MKEKIRKEYQESAFLTFRHCLEAGATSEKRILETLSTSTSLKCPPQSAQHREHGEENARESGCAVVTVAQESMGVSIYDVRIKEGRRSIKKHPSICRHITLCCKILGFGVILHVALEEFHVVIYQREQNRA